MTLERLKDGVRSWIRQMGYEVTPSGLSADMEPAFRAVHERVQPLTMGTTERLYALYKAVQYLEQRRVPGDLVECGVWKGGSAMAMALTMLTSGSSDRRIWLYDTYEGMTEPGGEDVDFRGRDAKKAWRTLRSGDESTWCRATLDEVRGNLRSTGYPEASLVFVAGRVEETIPAQAPDQIALLRLDTDWYASTRHELEHLYPRLAPGGVLIIDDYGYWRGAREATDAHLATLPDPPLLVRVDMSARVGVKP